MKPKDLNRINESEFKKGELMRKDKGKKAI